MTPTNSGLYLSETPLPASGVDVRLAAFEAELDQYEISAGMGPGNQLEILNSMTPEQLSAMTADECGELAARLSLLATHVTKWVNRETARANFCEQNIRSIIQATVFNTPGYSYEERRVRAVAHDVPATKLEAHRIKAQARIDRLSYMAVRIDSVARAFIELQQTRRRRVNG